MDDIVKFSIFNLDNDIIEDGFIRGNTVKDLAKYEMSRLAGGLASYYPNVMYIGATAKTVNAGVTTWFDTVFTSNINYSTLTDSTVTLGCSTLTYPGTYHWVGCGNNFYASTIPYSSIATTLVVGDSQKIWFNLLWEFSGQALGMFADDIMASRWGNISNGYNMPISSIILSYLGVDQQSVVADANVISGTLDGSYNGSTTLVLRSNTSFTGPITFDKVLYSTASGPASKWFDSFTGFIMAIPAGETLTFDGKYVFDTIAHTT
jgi:hypothetical protein